MISCELSPDVLELPPTIEVQAAKECRAGVGTSTASNPERELSLY